MASESLTTLLRDWHRESGVSPEVLVGRLEQYLDKVPAVRTYYDYVAGKSWPLEPDLINALSRITLIPVVLLVRGMGYAIEVDGIHGEDELTLVSLSRQVPSPYLRATIEGLRREIARRPDEAL